MKREKLYLILIVVATVFLLSMGSTALGGNPPPASPIITGPEYWGVLVINCLNNTVTLRVKRVVDCEVETQALTLIWPSAVCPLTESAIINNWFAASIFGQTGNPIITKVKNFKPDPDPASPNIFSADVQIRFCTNCP